MKLFLQLVLVLVVLGFWAASGFSNPWHHPGSPAHITPGPAVTRMQCVVQHADEYPLLSGQVDPCK